MKRSVILCLAACCLAVQTYGQGRVTFVAVNITNSLTGALAVAGTTFHVALYWLPNRAIAPTSADFEAPNSTAHLACLTNLTLNGGANAGVVRIEGITPSGAPAWFQVRAWENVLGVTDTWEAMLARGTDATGTRGALAGTSNIGRIDTADPWSGPPGMQPADTANTAITLKGFAMVPVPEPSAIGLSALGFGILFLLRRRG